MDKEIRELLDEEIKAQISKLSHLETGSKEKSTAIEDLATLYRLSMEEPRGELDFIEHYIAKEREEQMKKEQLTEQGKERYFRLGVEAAGIILPLIFYASWMKKGFAFEESGTFTSATFRGLFSRFKATRK